jgi:small-conductance mechanosensitive channel
VKLFGQAPRISFDSLSQAFLRFVNAIVDKLPNLLAAIVVFFLTVLVARLMRRGVEAALRRTSTEAYVHLLVAKLAHLGVMLVGIVVALSIVGVQLGILVASLGLATVALGFALQDILSNFVAGIILLLEHPFTRGDVIEAGGVTGVVEDIRVRATQLRTADGRQVLVPNKVLFTSVLTNASATMRRRVEVSLHVPYSQDSARVRAALLETVASVDGVATDPRPQILTRDFGEGALGLELWFWVDPRVADLNRVRSEVLERAEDALRRAGVTLAVPQLTANLAVPGDQQDPHAAVEGRDSS